MMYMGRTGVYANVFKLDQKENCPICSSKEVKLKIDKNMKVFEFVNK